MRLRTVHLILVPILVRLALVPFVADFEADAYARMLLGARIADALREGKPLLSAMYVPVWPPAWHLTCAAVELVWRSVYFVPKVLAALFGGLVPFLVHRITRRLAPDGPAAELAWLVACVSPLSLLYATSGMSEAFFGFWFVLAAYCLLRAERANRWLLAAAAALVPATLTRFDGWILVPALVPLALWQRRATVGTALSALAIVGLGPLAWLALNLAVAGRPDAFLATHTAYLGVFYGGYKYGGLYGDRGPLGLLLHLGAILGTTGVAMAVVGVRAARRRWRAADRDARAVIAWLLVAFLYLFGMWLLRRQVGWRRHYLALASLFTPFAALGLAALSRRRRAAWLAVDLFLLAAATTPFLFAPGRWVETAAEVARRDGVVYCDEPGVRVLSRLPAARFVVDAPPAGPDELVAWLRAKQVRWVVFSEVDYSPLPGAFPWMRTGESRPPFRRVFAPESNGPFRPYVSLYALE